MATPVVASSAALLRQYFTDGFWPSGAAYPADAFVPSAALLRALLIGGAVPIGGVEANTGRPVDPPPSSRQGFGRVHLGEWVTLALIMEKDAIACMHLEEGRPAPAGGPLAVDREQCSSRTATASQQSYSLLAAHGYNSRAGNSVHLAGSPGSPNLALLDRVPIKKGGAPFLQTLRTKCPSQAATRSLRAPPLHSS